MSEIKNGENTVTTLPQEIVSKSTKVALLTGVTGQVRGFYYFKSLQI
jgi:hypothetical protein